MSNVQYCCLRSIKLHIALITGSYLYNDYTLNRDSIPQMCGTSKTCILYMGTRRSIFSWGGGGVNVVKTLPLVTAILYKGKKQYPSLGQN